MQYISNSKGFLRTDVKILRQGMTKIIKSQFQVEILLKVDNKIVHRFLI